MQAVLKIIQGTEQGQSFELTDELIHIGSDPENQIVLNDEHVHGHHASIVQRKGRFAIFSPEKEYVHVDGTAIPEEQWVWLPHQASIRLADNVELSFKSIGGDESQPVNPFSESRNDIRVDPRRNKSSKAKTATFKLDKAKSILEDLGEKKPSDSETTGSRDTEKSGHKKSKKSVAKFIRDKGGEALVKLGADGKLPELELSELSEKQVEKQQRQQQQQKKQSDPTILFIALGVSFFMSIGMLLIDPGQFSGSERSVATARLDLQKFYENPQDQELKLYQLELREARLAHARGDRQQEKQHYRNVLKLLNSEDVNPQMGMTGRGPAADEELRKILAVLLAK